MTGHARLFCLRHAESENVVTGTAGVLPSAPLTPNGRSQAVRAAAVLGPEPLAAIYSSTAVRARDTADIIARTLGARTLGARTLGIETIAVPELLEVGIGTAEGAADPTTRARTAEVLHAWVVHRDLSARVADGETGHDVVSRISCALSTIAASHPGQTVAVVGHVASLTVALNELCELGDGVWGTPLPHAVPFLVEWDGTSWSCTSWPRT